MAQYYYLRVVSATLRYPFQLPCDDIKTDLTASVGGFDASVIVIRNAMDFIPNAQFNKTTLLQSLRKTNPALAGVRNEILKSWNQTWRVT
jgi:hypothetical protein